MQRPRSISLCKYKDIKVLRDNLFPFVREIITVVRRYSYVEVYNYSLASIIANWLSRTSITRLHHGGCSFLGTIDIGSCSNKNYRHSSNYYYVSALASNATLIRSVEWSPRGKSASARVSKFLAERSHKKSETRVRPRTDIPHFSESRRIGLY